MTFLEPKLEFNVLIDFAIDPQFTIFWLLTSF